MARRTIIVCLLSVCVLVPGSAFCEVSAPPAKDILQTASADGSFNTLIKALKVAGLAETLKQAGPFTVFAPTDEAFQNLPEGALESLLLPENREKLIALLKMHVVLGKLTASEIVRRAKLPAIGETDLLVFNAPGVIKIDRAQITRTNIPASNGMIHVIDRVLEPKDILETLKATGQFKTLLDAAKKAGLANTLQNTQARLTLFAPTDKAFAALPPATLHNLLLPENCNRLAEILKYHILPKPILLLNQSPRTLQGRSVKLQTSAPATVDNAKIILADIKTTNGVVQVIDRVLQPKASANTPAEKAVNVIKQAIDQGVPLFNSYKFQACVSIYDETVRSLLSEHAQVLTAADRQRLRKALADIKNDHNPQKKAWTLRYALDDVLKSLKQRK